MNKFIKKVDDFFNEVNEAFNNPLEIKWVDKGSLIGLFTVNDNVYKINCQDYGNNIWKYNFYLYNEKDNTFGIKPNNNEKDKYRVLPTVKSGMEYLISNKIVEAIIFGALDSSRGRKKLYESFCEDFSKKHDFSFYTKINEDKQLFILYKDSIDREVMFSKLKEMIKDEK
jgi:hypothetical protein